MRLATKQNMFAERDPRRLAAVIYDDRVAVELLTAGMRERRACG
jgi:hypothetical protein